MNRLEMFKWFKKKEKETIEFENGSKIECIKQNNVIRGKRAKILFPDIKPMSKPEVWKSLDGKTVKCIYAEDKNSEDKDCRIFAVQDLEDNKVYILDEKVGDINDISN